MKFFSRIPLLHTKKGIIQSRIFTFYFLRVAMNVRFYVPVIMIIFNILGCLERKQIRGIDHPGYSAEVLNEYKIEPELKNIYPLDATKLAVTQISISPYYYGSYRANQIAVSSNRETQYYRYTVCQEDSNNCRQGAFALTYHILKGLPDGKLTITVWPCVEEQNAKNPRQNCGNPKKSMFIQEPLSNPEQVKPIIEELDEVEQQITEKCKEAAVNSMDFQKKSEDSNIKTASNNFSTLGEHQCTDLVKEGYLHTVHENLMQVENNQLNNHPKDNEKTTYAAALIGLGSVSLLTGIVLLAQGSVPPTIPSKDLKNVATTDSLAFKSGSIPESGKNIGINQKLKDLPTTKVIGGLLIVTGIAALLTVSINALELTDSAQETDYLRNMQVSGERLLFLGREYQRLLEELNGV